MVCKLRERIWNAILYFAGRQPVYMERDKEREAETERVKQTRYLCQDVGDSGYQPGVTIESLCLVELKGKRPQAGT